MQLTRLFRDDEAVSEVVGVILMVAITVILAAVIASVVLGIGGETQTTPQASFAWDWSVDNSNNGLLEVTHDSGESIKETELFVRGDFGNGTSAGAVWDGSTSTSIGSTSAVASGDSFVISNNSGVGEDTQASGLDGTYDLRVVWQPPSGETSATLGQDTGPDA